MDCSILISTKNRAAALAKTLHAFGSVQVPDGLEAELIVVDNGSTDNTWEVISKAQLPAMQLTGIREPQPGKSRALNTAIKNSRGRALLFTDDDVLPAQNWLEHMSMPLLDNRCDAVAGRILLAEELRRPWFGKIHPLWLAERRDLREKNPELVGASMGMRREVFDQIPGFNTDMGPGVPGLGGEDTLLWMQLVERGMRILPVHDTEVIHYPDSSRLSHSSWMAAARQNGTARGFILHHWNHHHDSMLLLRESWYRMKLYLRILLERGGSTPVEGCPEWELCYRLRIQTYHTCRTLAGTPRNYPAPADRAQSTWRS
jgi:glycosyltransferase involved in cell wall biosynthesis